MEDPTIQYQALSELKEDARRRAVLEAKDIIKTIGLDQKRISEATARIEQLKKELANIYITEYSI